jgi:hypothetical protein
LPPVIGILAEPPWSRYQSLSQGTLWQQEWCGEQRLFRVAPLAQSLTQSSANALLQPDGKPHTVYLQNLLLAKPVCQQQHPITRIAKALYNQTLWARACTKRMPVIIIFHFLYNRQFGILYKTCN